MKVIRDEECGGIMMLPILIDWDIHRCNVKGCKNEPTTIVTETEAPVFGLCEDHYQEGVEKGKMKLELEFDNII